MRSYVFAGRGAMPDNSGGSESLAALLEEMAGDTPTQDLVTVIYLLNGHSHWKAHTVIGWRTPAEFVPARGRWKFARRFGTPADLPERFRIIRMAFGMAEAYPRTFDDIHGWRLTCGNFAAHLAYAFAHELHHFRRYHLALHPREGEQAACRWALGRARQAGYPLEGVRLPRRRKRRRRPRRLNPHFERLRALPDGAPVLIVRDSAPSSYVGQTALKVRTLRRNSRRLALRTADGSEWLWPMQWLRPAIDPKAQAPPPTGGGDRRAARPGPLAGGLTAGPRPVR